jgi:CBS domain-containing protein
VAFAWLLMGLGVWQFFLGAFIGGLWMLFIGMFLNQAAHASYRQLVVRQALQGEPVCRVMNPHPIVVAPETDLRSWVEDYVYRHHHKMFPVVSGERVEGVVGTRALKDFPRSEWDRHTVAEAMRRDVQAIRLPPDADAFTALETMQRTGSSQLLVMDDDRLAGIVSLKDLMRFLELKLDLEGNEREQEAGNWDDDARREEPAGRH